LVREHGLRGRVYLKFGNFEIKILYKPCLIVTLKQTGQKVGKEAFADLSTDLIKVIILIAFSCIPWVTGAVEEK